jgi:hypothetical protein
LQDLFVQFAFMKPFLRSLGFHFLLGLFGVQTIGALFAADKQSSPESTLLKQLDPGCPREVTRNGIRFPAVKRQLFFEA